MIYMNAHTVAHSYFDLAKPTNTEKICPYINMYIFIWWIGD